MLRILALALSLSLALPAHAQEHGDDHGHHDHDHDHDHRQHHDHGGAAADHSEDVKRALAEGGTLVEVSILGMVCDFCATALTKTFGRRDEVAAVQVDLNTKRLRVAFNKGQTLDDSTITGLVGRSGYKVKTIARAQDTEKPQ